MYPREATSRLVALVNSGVIDLSGYTVTEFALDAVAEAIDHAAVASGPFEKTALRVSAG